MVLRPAYPRAGIEARNPYESTKRILTVGFAFYRCSQQANPGGWVGILRLALSKAIASNVPGNIRELL